MPIHVIAFKKPVKCIHENTNKQNYIPYSLENRDASKYLEEQPWSVTRIISITKWILQSDAITYMDSPLQKAPGTWDSGRVWLYATLLLLSERSFPRRNPKHISCNGGLYGHNLKKSKLWFYTTIISIFLRCYHRVCLTFVNPRTIFGPSSSECFPTFSLIKKSKSIISPQNWALKATATYKQKS